MHEYSLVDAMLDQVDAIRLAQRADRVCSIRVGIGEFAGVEPDLFLDAFDLLCRPIETSGRIETRGQAQTRGSAQTMEQAATARVFAAGETEQVPSASGPCHELGPCGNGPYDKGGARKRTVWDQTDLQMHIIPLEAQCNQCNQVFHMENFHFQCPGCNSGDLTILQGEDLILESVTLEEA